MKLPLPVVLTFIFVMQLHYSESKVQIAFSIFPHTRNFTIESGDEGSAISEIFVNGLNKIQTSIKNQDDSHENDIIDNIVPEEDMENQWDEDPIIRMSSMTSPQLIVFHGYPVESHRIVTDDGYVLTVHRIPYSKKSDNKGSPRKTVLLHHGLYGNSAHWLLAGPTKSLGYILADAGYDVWLANVRGNTYSRDHVSKNVDSDEFWNFSFHEVSQHDLPAVIDYIMAVKGSDVKINYIGHSMGTTVLFALLSTKTQYNEVLRAGFALAPVAYMTHIKGPIKKLAKYSNEIEYVLQLLGGGSELRIPKSTLRWLAENSQGLMSLDEEGEFENMMSVFFGHDVQQFNKTLLPLILGQGFSGASTKTLVHYAQEIEQGGKFQMFDYGPAGNLNSYGTFTPPEYPLHKITLPIALFSGENDRLSSVIDVTRLQKKLVNPIEHYIVPLKEFNHGDFLWAIDAPTLVYARILELLGDGVSKVDAFVNILDNHLSDNLLHDNVRKPADSVNVFDNNLPDNSLVDKISRSDDFSNIFDNIISDNMLDDTFSKPDDFFNMLDNLGDGVVDDKENIIDIFGNIENW